MEKYGGNLPKRKLRRAAKPAPKKGSALAPLATPRALAKAKPAPKGKALQGRVSKTLTVLPGKTVRVKPTGRKAKYKGGGLPVLKDAAGIARVIGHGTAAVAESTYKHPGKAVTKTATSAGEIAKGVAGAAIGLPLYAVEHPIKTLSGEGATHVAERMVKGTVKGIEDKYGPSFRGEKGAYKKLEKKVEKEGPLPTALDIATLVAPASSGLGKAARLETKVRPALKVEPLKAGTKQAARPSVVGAGVAAAHDTARKSVQATAQARSTQRLRTRVPGVKARHIEGRPPSLLNTEPKPLTARRAALAPGEVAPISEKAANRTLRRTVAEEHTRGKTAGRLRVVRHVTGKKDSLRAAFKPLPEDLHHAAITAAQLGIRDSAAAPGVLRARVAEIERARAAPVKKDAKAQARAAKTGDEGELPKLQSYLADPKVFDRADVQAAADATRARVVGPREGLGAERAASGRSKLQGRTLGVKPAAELHADAKAAHASRLQAADANVAAKRAEVVKQQQALGRARLLTREAAIGKGPIRVSDPATLKSISRQQGKLQQKRTLGSIHTARVERTTAQAALDKAKQAALLKVNSSGKVSYLHLPEIKTAYKELGVEDLEHKLTLAKSRLAKADASRRPSTLTRVAGHGEDVVRSTRGLSVAKQELQAARAGRAKLAAAAPRAVKETPTQYEARVAAAAQQRGLAAPEYTPSHFENEGLKADRPTSGGPSNPMGKEKSGTLYRLGREHKSLEVVESSQTASLKRGAAKQAEAHILGRHGIPFDSPEAATDFARGLGLSTERIGKTRPDVAIHSPITSEAARTLGVKPIKGAKADAGDYVKTKSVFLVPRAVKEELDALDLAATRAPSMLQKLAHYPQAALLALSPSWFQFQRVNDAIAATAGGSLQHTVALEKLRRSLDPDSREVLHTMSGGSISSELLTPFSAQKIGRLQRILDDNKIYQKAFGGQNPATVLLRADQAITHGVRERQLLHNLSIVARKMDPDVSAVQRAFGPIGHAFKTADVELAQKLLKDPRYTAQLEDAAQRLYKIHGDWHNYTAREQALKHYAAFYGFLRYATRMAFYTLPINHPHIGLLIGQLGQMGAADAKKIIGPDLPYGLSALYNDDGTIAADFTRANPLLGPVLSITKPEQVLGLATPLAGITMNYLLGQPIGLSDSTEGRIKQYTVEGDPTRHDVGSFVGKNRARIGADQVLGLLSPYREWKKFDGRQQSSDSLPWDRRYLESTTAAGQVGIDEKNAAAKGSDKVAGLVHDLVPLVSAGSKKNVGAQGAAVTAAKQDAAVKRKLNAVKRESALHGLGALDRQLQMLDAQIKASEDKQNAPLKALDDQLKLIDAQLGG